MVRRLLRLLLSVVFIVIAGCEAGDVDGNLTSSVDASLPGFASDDTFEQSAPDAEPSIDDGEMDTDDVTEADADDAGDTDDTSDEGGGPIVLPPIVDVEPSVPGGVDVGGDTGPTPECMASDDCVSTDPCTQGVCYAGECVQVMHSDPCDDGDPCTEDDVCNQGECAGVAFDCDDDDPCTVDDACIDGDCAGTPMVCDDDNPCTINACFQGECKHPVMDQPGCQPTLEIFEPARAATLTDQTDVSIVGKVTSPASPVVSLTINGTGVDVSDDGYFTHSLNPRTGITILTAEATDAFEQTARIVQSFAYGQDVAAPGSYAQPTPIEGGLVAWVDRALFDDDNTDDLDDMATLVQTVIEGFDLNAALPEPLVPEDERPSFGWCTWDVGVEDITIDLDTVDLYPVDDGLALKITFKDFYAWVSATAGGACPDAIGSATSDEITVTGLLLIDIDEGGVDVTLSSLDVDIAEIELDIQEGLGQLFDWVINWFEDDLTNIVKDEIEGQVANQVAPLLATVLEAIADFTFDFEVPAIPPNEQSLPMRLSVSPSDAVLSPNGLELGLTGGFGTDKAISHDSPGALIGGCVGVSSGPGASCLGACGGQSPSGCWCDQYCATSDDCCDDFWPLCSSPPTEGSGACCSKASEPGCAANSDCEACVCGDDPYCCSNGWDTLCSGRAANLCAVSCGCEALCCGASADESPGCITDACETCVCDLDPYCCEFKWDSICAKKAATTCDGTCQCGETCCESGDKTSCPNPSCDTCVCDMDDYCCSVEWDVLCANIAEDECAKSCGCFSGESSLAGSALPHLRPIEVMAYESVMNRFFFAIWWGGHMHMDVGNDQLEATVGDLGLPGLALMVDPHLPPMVTSCTPSGKHELQLGDVLMTASFDLMGMVQSVTFFASARVRAYLELVETDEGLHTIGIQIGDVLEASTQLVETSGDSPLLDSIDNAFIDTALKDLFISEYLTGISAALPAKTFNLGDYVPGLPAGSTVALDPTHLDVLGAAVMLGGELVSAP